MKNFKTIRGCFIDNYKKIVNCLAMKIIVKLEWNLKEKSILSIFYFTQINDMIFYHYQANHQKCKLYQICSKCLRNHAKSSNIVSIFYKLQNKSYLLICKAHTKIIILLLMDPSIDTIKCTYKLGDSLDKSPHIHEPFRPIQRKIYDDVLDAIGNTPMIKINKVGIDEGIECELLAKC